MDHKKFGSTDLMVPPIVVGTWPLGGDFFGEMNDARAAGMVHSAIDAGLNFFDTAPNYGASEERLGKALKGRRDKVVLATKTGQWKYRTLYFKLLNPMSIRVQLEDSLRLLQTDYLDLYQIHWPDANNPMEPALEELQKLQKEGKIRYFGVCNHTPDELRLAAKYGAVSHQVEYSMMKRGTEKEVLPLSKELGLGTMTYGALCGGLLTGKIKEPKPTDWDGLDRRARFYPGLQAQNWEKSQKLVQAVREVAEDCGQSMANVAIRWNLQNKNVDVALIGMSKPEQPVENAKAVGFTLSDEAMAKLNTASAEYL